MSVEVTMERSDRATSGGIERGDVTPIEADDENEKTVHGVVPSGFCLRSEVFWRTVSTVFMICSKGAS